MRMKAIDPEIACGFLTETWILEAGSYVENHQVEAYHPAFWMVTDEEAADLKAHGRQINTWTVNEPEHIRRMIALQVDGIIGNYPDRTKKELEAAGLR